MVKIAFKVVRLGTELQVTTFRHPGSEPVFTESYSFDGAAIKDDGQSDLPPKQRSVVEEAPHGEWNIKLPQGLERGGFKLKINFDVEQVILTPVSPLSNCTLGDMAVRYNFSLLGIQDNRTTDIEQAKNKIIYTVKKH